MCELIWQKKQQSIDNSSHIFLLSNNLCTHAVHLGKLLKYRYLIITEYIQFLPRDASAERGDATVSRLSVCLSVRP